MRTVDVARIKDAVSELCLKANFELRKDVLKALKKFAQKETNLRAKNILRSIIENAKIAKSKRIAICQDTGMVSVFIELGRDVALSGSDLYDAVNAGVEEAYRKGFLRKSVVRDPVLRENTNTNTPAIIHVNIVPGDRVRISVLPKGFGCENKSRVKMFRPTSGMDEIKDFIMDTVRTAGPDACPPLVLGIGMGGTLEKAALIAKTALLRAIDEGSSKKHIRNLEKDLLKEINSSGIGPMGLGGKTTALGVNIEAFPTHIAALPVAVNVSCHATRSATAIL